jgi:hypothetical protein
LRPRSSVRIIENAETQTAALEEKIESQARRIDTLADDVANGRTSRHAEEDAALAAITDEMSYDAVSSAIRDADHRGIISTVLRVPASEGLDGMHMVIQNTVLMDRVVGDSPRLSLSPWFADNRDVPGDWWLPGEDVTSVIGRLEQRIESANLDPPIMFDPTLMFQNLREALTLVYRSLRGESERRLRGPLLERLNDEWALTDEGLESLTTEDWVPIGVFPDTIPRFQDPGTPAFTPPPPPRGVEASVWAQLIEIARVTYMVHGKRSLQRRGFPGR